MPLAGYMTSRDDPSFAGVVAGGTAGAVLSAPPLYYPGRKVGGERLEEFADSERPPAAGVG